MSRVIIERTILDSLIRAKIASLDGCAGVEPMPVAHREGDGGCNWHVPGWTGDAGKVGVCSERVSGYVSFLQAQFDIAPEKRS